MNLRDLGDEESKKKLNQNLQNLTEYTKRLLLNISCISHPLSPPKSTFKSLLQRSKNHKTSKKNLLSPSPRSKPLFSKSPASPRSPQIPYSSPPISDSSSCSSATSTIDPFKKLMEGLKEPFSLILKDADKVLPIEDKRTLETKYKKLDKRLRSRKNIRHGQKELPSAAMAKSGTIPGQHQKVQKKNYFTLKKKETEKSFVSEMLERLEKQENSKKKQTQLPMRSKSCTERDNFAQFQKFAQQRNLTKKEENFTSKMNEPLNFFEKYKEISSSKPFPYAMVDFIKKGSKYLDQMRKAQSSSNFRLGPFSAKKSHRRHVVVSSLSERTKIKKNKYEDSATDKSNIGSFFGSMYSPNKTRPKLIHGASDQPQPKSVEKTLKKQKMERRKNYRILKDLPKCKIPWNIELEHKLSEVKRFAFYRKQISNMPCSRSGKY
ncbi:unnamed protein product [Moneuplotes crassus]|uniref:Uncharacterized protein n=1 Tax=Euplotes crassus TaxID=5936 RepID=A0AAD2DD49_EUPCR|nr:unnamed protein product [Moneuplotes crassus]